MVSVGVGAGLVEWIVLGGKGREWDAWKRRKKFTREKEIEKTWEMDEWREGWSVHYWRD